MGLKWISDMILAKIEKPFMETQHLTYFKIQNFKRFDSLEVKNIGQFNLIVGDNNVGKTSLLEALLFDESPKNVLQGFLFSLSIRKLISVEFDKKLIIGNLWGHVFKNVQKPISIEFDKEKWFFEFINDFDKEDLKYLDSLSQTQYAIAGLPESYIRITDTNQDRYLVPAEARAVYQQTFFPKKRFNIVPVYKFYDDDLVDLFSEPSKDKETRKRIISGLQKIITGLEDVRLTTLNGNTQISLDIEGEKQSLPLARFGDGAIKTFRLLLEVIAATGKRLMIDEIETGLHWTRQKGFWQIIIQLCKEHQVQLFATTHSLECQQNFAAALEEESMKEFRQEVRNISMIETAKGEVETVTFDFEQFKYALEIGYNTRGGVNE